jgi:23S rRNA (guanosine2251-2'-O)-methyltransferase
MGRRNKSGKRQSGPHRSGSEPSGRERGRSGQRGRGLGKRPEEPVVRPPKGVPKKSDQLEGRNVVVEVFRRKRRGVHRVWIDDRAKPDDKIVEIETLAAASGCLLERVSRDELDERSVAGVHNGVLAWAEPLPVQTLREILDGVFAKGELPFIVLLDEVNYEHNLGAVLRSAMGAGVHAVVVPVRRGKGLTPVVQRVAMGGAEVVPVVREGLSSALATLRREGIRVVGADMGGQAYWKVPMSGALAVVLGGEHKGLSPTLKKRCDDIVAVPLEGQLDSLNVSVTAGILLFERVRQESDQGS